MRLDHDTDFSEVDMEKLASLMRRKADELAPGARQEAEIDTALACEALAQSRASRLRSLARIPAK